MGKTEADTLDQLAEYLRGAAILHSATFAIQASPELSLGAGERGRGSGQAGRRERPAVRSERGSAWEVSRLLGWADMVSVTVLRQIPSFQEARETSASVQVLWPDNQPDIDRDFSDMDVWRAAVFDALICQTDRNGHNWLAVPSRDPAPGLKLVDHAYAFAPDATEPSSSFFEARRGWPLPSHVTDALRDLLDHLPTSPVAGLLPPEAVDGLADRARRLLDNGRLQLP